MVICVIIIVVLQLWILIPILLLAMILVTFCATFYVGVRPIYRLRYWRSHKERLLEVKSCDAVISIDNLGLSPHELQRLQEEIVELPEIVIADIDQDGHLLSRYGPIAGAQNVLPEDFLKRKRNDLQMVAIGEKVGVKKNFNQNRKGFLSELEVLHSLRGRCNVPAILDLDFSNLSIVFSFIPGVVIREELARRGAKIRHRDLDGDQNYQSLSRDEQKRRRIVTSRRVLNDYFHLDMKEEIFSELKKIHKLGVLVTDLKYGNIIIERDTGIPFFIDFDFAKNFGYPRGIQGEVKRDIEIKRFNFIFDSNKPTRKRLLQEIKEISQTDPQGHEFSVIFGHGLAFGRTWDVSFGEGLWHYLIEPNIPKLDGMRILDLGCRDPLFSLRMLLKGASEVVRIEPDEQWGGNTRFLKEGFEWSYSSTLNLIVLNSKMEEISSLKLGNFDFIFAQESLFSLPVQAFESLLQYLCTLSNKVIIHCLQNPNEITPESCYEASLENNISILERNGFHVDRVISPKGCTRQLLIAEYDQK
jgi:tRNA A-37 threonylcarbamoyl transferase component Bud32